MLPQLSPESGRFRLMQPSKPSTGAADADGAASEPGPTRRRHRPLVERIACWSARHRAIALVAWLVVVAGALFAGHVYGTASQPEYDPGQSGVAERMLSQLDVVTPPSESVLIQSRTPGPERTFAAYPPLRLAALQVVTALRALPTTAANIQSPFRRNGKALSAPGCGGVLIGGGADHRDGRGDRLHAVLPAAGARGTSSGRDFPRRPAHRGGDFGPGNRDLRSDRDDLAGRTAVHRDRHVHRVRDRDDDGRRRGRGRLAHRASGSAVAARTVG